MRFPHEHWECTAMATFTGHLLSIKDFLAFFGSHSSGVESLSAHHVEIVVRTLVDLSQIDVKGHTIDLPEPSWGLGPPKIYRGITGDSYSSFSIEVPDQALQHIEDVQLVVRDQRNTIIYRSARTPPHALRTALGEVYVVHDALSRVPDIQAALTKLGQPDPFAETDIPKQFDTRLYQDLAAPKLDGVVASLIKTIESGNFTGIGKEQVASTVTDLRLDGNMLGVNVEFYKHANGMTRLNTGGPPQEPVKRFLTLSFEAAVKPTQDYEASTYVAADVIDVGVTSTKVLVALGAPFVDKTKYLPANTESDLGTSLDAALRPFVRDLSNAIVSIADVPLLSSLSGLLSTGITATLTGFDTAPDPRTRAPQLRPIAAVGFPKSPLASI
jgi:hypothetical protein